jgi:hypothetical protein
MHDRRPSLSESLIPFLLVVGALAIVLTAGLDYDPAFAGLCVVEVLMLTTVIRRGGR